MYFSFCCIAFFVIEKNVRTLIHARIEWSRAYVKLLHIGKVTIRSGC